jgi:acid stress-induced BolA-like protein IbaG/YrbA
MEDLEREREIKDRLTDHMQKNNIKQVDIAKETGKIF